MLRGLVDEVSSRTGERRVPHDTLVGWLIDCGEIEAAVTDALCVETDAPHALARACADVTHAAADAVVASWRSHSWTVASSLARALGELGELASRVDIDSIQRPVSEGFAYYGLTPEMYIDAAAIIAQRWRPRRVGVIGIRSIGTSLAAVVASELTRHGVDCDTVTVRPRGHPFSRRLVLASALEDDWRRHAQQGALFVIVDEGPGLSGSSFAAVIAALLRVGIDAERIILMPSWQADASRLLSDEARALWPRVAAVTAPFQCPREWRDISAGAWRRDVFRDPADYPPVHPHHERRKYRVGDAGDWLKWAGLGRYGVAHHARAVQIAEWGFGPPPLSLASGFLAFPHVSGQPLQPHHRVPELLSTIAEYLARIACDCRCDAVTSTPHATLADMLRVNVEEGLGREWLAAITPQPDADALIVRPDARMAPHEWLRMPDDGFVKTDGFEHGDDHFYPGPTDIAWDVAATCVEWRLTPREEASLLPQYRARSGDVHIAQRLPFFRAAYLAFRLGYATLAASAPIGDDAARFAAARDRYASLLRATLTPRLRSAASSARRSRRTPMDTSAGSCDADESRTPRA